MMYQCGRCGLTRASGQEPIGSVLPQCRCPWEFTPPVMQQPQQRPSRSDMTWVGLTDEEVRLIAYNECPEDWDSLENKECWLKGFVNGFKASEQEHKT